jgi:hypothetical protein
VLLTGTDKKWSDVAALSLLLTTGSRVESRERAGLLQGNGKATVSHFAGTARAFQFPAETLRQPRRGASHQPQETAEEETPPYQGGAQPGHDQAAARRPCGDAQDPPTLGAMPGVRGPGIHEGVTIHYLQIVRGRGSEGMGRSGGETVFLPPDPPGFGARIGRRGVGVFGENAIAGANRVLGLMQDQVTLRESTHGCEQ